MNYGWQSQDIDEAFSFLVPPSQQLTPTDTLSQSQPFSPKTSKGVNKTLLVIVSMISGILIIGGGVFAYFNYFQSPEKIIQKMNAKLNEVKSLEYSGEIKGEINIENLLSSGGRSLQLIQPTQNKKTSNYSINFTGKSDIQKLDDPKDLFYFNIKTDALMQGEFTFESEIRNIGKFVYFKLSDVPNLGFFDLSVIKNQWIKIDTEALKKQFGLEKTKEQSKETQQIPREKLKLAFQQAKIIKTAEKLPNEKIEGVNTHHFKFTIDKEGVKKLFIDITQIMQIRIITEKELSRIITEKQLSMIDEVFKAIEFSEGEIWIGKKDLLPYKISLSLLIKETDKSKTLEKINFVLLLKNFNKPVQIDVPAQAKPLEEILEGLSRGLQILTPDRIFLPPQSQDFSKDTDKDGLPDQLEIIYGTNPNKADTDGDGFIDSEEIEKGYNPKGPGKLC